MPAYLIPETHAEAVGSGRQRALLAPPRALMDEGVAVHAPHAVVGDVVYVDLPRTRERPRRRLAQRRCILRARLVLDRDHLVRALDVRFKPQGPDADEAERIARLIAAAEHNTAQDPTPSLRALARLSGFDDWPSAYTHHASFLRRGRPDAQGRITRELVVWSAS